ncbi:MAG: EAL domain-containing protein [Desulfovermiculus sp.]|nr:EAL domain-containing protein [Desulfovermiculus sp.]
MPSYSSPGRPNNAYLFAHSFQELHDIFWNAPIGIFKSTPEGRFLSANPALARIYGFNHPEQLINSITDIDVQLYVDPNDRIEFKRRLDQYGEIVNYEYRLRRRDGSAIWVSTNAQVMRDNDGNISYQGYTADITERKRAEEIQNSVKMEYEKVFHSTQDAMFLIQVVDEDHFRYVRNNRAHQQATEFSCEYLRGKTPQELVGNELGTIVAANYRRCVQEAAPISYVETLDLPAGKRTWQTTLTPVFQDGQPVYIVGSSQDITQRKQAEETLQQKSWELEKRVKELDCLSGLSRLMEQQPAISRQELMQSAVEFIPPAWQYPDMTCARLLLDGEAFRTWGFRETAWKQSADIEVSGNKAGRIEVFCLLEAPECDEGPFLREERELIENITKRLGQYLEREQGKEALRRSEHYYRTIFETSGSAMLIIEENTTISVASSNFEELSGYSKHEIEGKKSWTDFVHPDDVEWMKEYHYLRRRDSHAAPRNYEFRFLSRNGEVRHGYLTVGMIPDTAQNVFSLADITHRKEAEERLRTAHDKVDTLVQLNADGLMVLDQDGIILFVNPAGVEMLGREQDELWGEQFGHPLIPGSNTEIELLSNSGEARVVELRGRETEWSGQTALLVSFRDITERKRAEERIYYLAYYDELTDLPNRRLFYDRLKQATARCEHFSDHGFLLMVDVTRLREVNDTLGQQAGDELIREVARRLGDAVGEEDTVARVSGGEFMVLSEGKDAGERAHKLGVLILEKIGRELELSGRLVYPGVNIGFTLFPQRGTDPDILIKQGDIALSEAKKSAHRIQEFAGQEDWISRQFHLEHDLKQALTNEEFFLCYQTQIDLRTGRIVGLEALLRWEHPQRGIVSPGEFIPVLENTGMIASVDEWVIHRVCKQLGSWQEKGIFMKTSVNLSAQELNDEGTIEVVRAALEAHGVRADTLEVEITETGLMTNVDRASQILQSLSNWGVRVALDDFGKGYSSLSYLQKLPINIIKIDKGFVNGLPEDKDSVTLVQTIIAMAHNLGKEVLAEGVERQEQRQKLCEMGCDYGQGFLWSRPQPVENLTFIGS